MPWQLTDDVETYADHAWDLLSGRPADNTVALTVVAAARAGRRWSEKPMVFGWYERPVAGGAGTVAVTGAVSLTPPYELLLAVVPVEAVSELLTALRDRGTPVPGVNGVDEVVDRFSAVWTAGTPLVATTAMRQRLYTLSEVRAPDPAPPGRARRAGVDDLELAVRWVEAFQVEAHTHAVDVHDAVSARIAAGMLWLWQDPGGTLVSLAGRSPAAAGVARVGPVYTPPQQRRRGYGAGVTAACTAAALRQDARQVVLFTDLANPTSNSVYQQIGFRALSDRKVVRFTPAQTARPGVRSDG